MRLRGRHYRTRQPTDVVVAGGVITSVGPPAGTPDREAGWIAPALFDLQINGCLGKPFVSPALTLDDAAAVVRACRRHGISGLCPTLITGSFDAVTHGLRVLRRACEQSSEMARAMPCFHLEGPYISPDDGPRGAHPLAHVRPPDDDEFRRLQDAAGGRVKLLTLAPETAGALGFIERRVREGVVVAIGHTAATPEQIRDAVTAGARLSTHLGNGSHALLPRHPNYLWEQLADDRLTASVIADGHHLPDALLRCFARVKGRGRLILTCDASSLAGSPPGRYREWGQEIDVLPGGKVVVPGTPFLAGSGVLLDACVAKMASLGELPLADVLDLAGANPRALLGLPAVDLREGSPADVLLFEDEPFRVVATFAG
ncbi:MAG: N-acetylglucosamine-6-phosphate deacetylase [Gemmataceae bacterium]